MYIISGGSSVQLLVPDQFLPTGKVSAITCTALISIGTFLRHSRRKIDLNPSKKRRVQEWSRSIEEKIINHYFLEHLKTLWIDTRNLCFRYYWFPEKNPVTLKLNVMPMISQMLASIRWNKINNKINTSL